MGNLYETLRRIEGEIERRRLPLYRTRGLIAQKTGFVLGDINADTPDDPGMLASLTAAAREVLGEGF